MTKAPVRKKAKAKPKRKAPKLGVARGRGGAVGVRGQPAFVATAEQKAAVCAHVSIGTSPQIISELLKIPGRTLRRHFKHELEHGKEVFHGLVGGRLAAQALTGHLTAAIFYAKAQMGWRDGYRVGFEDKDRNPVNPANLFQVNIT